MSKLDEIRNLQEILGELRDTTDELESNISRLKQTMDEDAFISDELSDAVRKRLEKVQKIQKKITSQYEMLKFGPLPCSMKQVELALEENRKRLADKECYMDAVQLFMNLHSEEAEIEALLKNRKQELAEIDLESEDAEQLKEKLGSYVWLKSAYDEPDAKKKFAWIYKLVPYFEEPIAMGLQFDLFTTAEPTVQEETANEEIPETMLPEQEDSEQEESTQEQLVSEQLEQEQPEPEQEEEQELSEVELWEKLHISHPDLLTVTENKELLKVEASLKAVGKFGVKEFKRDVAKQLMSTKLACMIGAFEGCGYTVESIHLWSGIPKEEIQLATDKLLHLGYINKYNVEGYGAFYCLSPRGEKAFLTKESCSFIYGTHMNKKKMVETNGEHIEDAANSAITRMLYFSIFARTAQLNPDYHFKTKEGILGTEYFVQKFPNVIDDEEVGFVGVVSENPTEFAECKEKIDELTKDVKKLIVIGVNQEHAKNLAEWVSMLFEEENNLGKVWYTSYHEEKLVDFLSGEEVIVNVEKAAEEEVSVENSDAEKVEEAAITQPEIPEDDQAEDIDSLYQKMLCKKQFYSASAYLKAVSKNAPEYENTYKQLAYALNDPMENCHYSSENMIDVYYSGVPVVSDYFVVAAALRNYFMDQFSYDYSLPLLQSLLAGNAVLNHDAVLDNIVYTLQKFKTDNHSGIDRYADYREKEHAMLEQRLDATKREARDYYENYVLGNLKENTSHRRFIQTRKLLLGQKSELSDYLNVVINDDREMLDLLEEFLKEKYVREDAVICAENLDQDKINRILDEYWELSMETMNSVKKTSDLMSSLRMNLFKMVSKIVGVLCNYVAIMKSDINKENTPGFTAYKKIRTPLLNDMQDVIARMEEHVTEGNLSEQSGKTVLLVTLREMSERLDGTYQDGSNRYYYVNFLKNDKVMLDEDYMPVLDEVLELPEFSLAERITGHFREEEKAFSERLQEIFNGEDDYGSASLILSYLKEQGSAVDEEMYDVEKAASFVQSDMENKRCEFIEDLELAQSYGKMDNTVENSKEMIVQIMETWYLWALETGNYGFFAKILKAFMDKIKKDAQVRAIELEKSLNVYLEENADWESEELVKQTVEKIRGRIEQQNYAAAEDLLNRLMANDIDVEMDIQETDYLAQFLDEYEMNYRKTAKAGETLRSALSTSRLLNKDTRGAGKLVEYWPKGANTGTNNLKNLLDALGFAIDTVKAEAPIQDKIESYLITLKRPQNGRKSNYKHPIYAFGSEAEEKGFRVVCLFGKTDAGRLVDTFKEIGNAKNTLVLLDYALTLADRRTLARKTKTDLTGKTFAVLDRVALIYLAKHYAETAVNRMLMSIVMPFAFYQPYIAKSADVMPQEMFIGRKNELEKIESPTGVNIVYGGRQLGKTALLRMAKKDVDRNENGDRAIIVDVMKKDYKQVAKIISAALYDEGFLKEENITEDWSVLARDIKNRLRDQKDPVPYFLLMIDEADTFIESCEEVEYQPFNELKDIQSLESGRFKFVVAGLRNIVRFKKIAALSNNSGLAHLESLTITPFRSMEARELLEAPLSYLGFRFPKDNETEVLISTIFGTTNYFPGLIQLYCTKLIEALRRDYAGYSESETPPYIVKKEHIKKVLAEQSLQQDIREKFFITLKVGEDDYYYIIALLVAYYYHKNKAQNGCSAEELMELAGGFDIAKLSEMTKEEVSALMEEMRELNVLQYTGDGKYRFTRHSFCQMMGTVQQIEDELMKYMED